MGDRNDTVDEVPGAGHHRRWPKFVFGIGLLVAVVGIGTYSRYRDRSDSVSIDDAVARFERRTPSPSMTADVTSSTTPDTAVAAVEVTAAPSSSVAEATRSLPPAGVYVYASSGREQIDALGGTTHEYPAETALIVDEDGCGVSVTWTPLEQRVESWTMCIEHGAITIADYLSEHEFFGTSDRTAMHCEPAHVLVPAPDAPELSDLPALPARSRTDCTGSGLDERRDVSLIGPAVVSVGGVDVDGFELEIAVTTTGSTVGTSTRHLIVDERGLPLVWTDTVTNTTDTAVGAVHYQETFTLTLTSLEPRQ